MKVGRTREADWGPAILQPHIPQKCILLESQDGSNIWAGYSLNYILRHCYILEQYTKFTYLR